MMAADAASFDVTTVMASVLGNMPLDVKCMACNVPQCQGISTVADAPLLCLCCMSLC